MTFEGIEDILDFLDVVFRFLGLICNADNFLHEILVDQ